MSKPSGVLVMFPREGFDYPMDAALEHEFRGLKHAGVGLLIYPGVLHGKLYIQDGQLSNIGSFNIDEASPGQSRTQLGNECFDRRQKILAASHEGIIHGK